MNLGLQDGKKVIFFLSESIRILKHLKLKLLADNLAWKMSDVLKGIAADPEKLLESYNGEV
jgi:hypothetical protein